MEESSGAAEVQEFQEFRSCRIRAASGCPFYWP
jgi:hypothetical protein